MGKTRPFFKRREASASCFLPRNLMGSLRNFQVITFCELVLKALAVCSFSSQNPISLICESLSWSWQQFLLGRKTVLWSNSFLPAEEQFRVLFFSRRQFSYHCLQQQTCELHSNISQNVLVGALHSLRPLQGLDECTINSCPLLGLLICPSCLFCSWLSILPPFLFQLFMLCSVLYWAPHMRQHFVVPQDSMHALASLPKPYFRSVKGLIVLLNKSPMDIKVPQKTAIKIEVSSHKSNSLS